MLAKVVGLLSTLGIVVWVTWLNTPPAARTMLIFASVVTAVILAFALFWPSESLYKQAKASYQPNRQFRRRHQNQRST